MDPYKVLGISKDTPQDKIKSSYWKIAKKYHPDLNPGSKDAEKKFKDINTANEILSDPEKRAKFDKGEIDENGNPVFQQPPEGPNQGPFYYETQNPNSRYTSTFEGMGAEFFENLFNTKPRSADENYKINISFKDAALGNEQNITLPSGKKLKVKIPAGIESGKRLRMKSQGEAKSDVYIEITVLESKLFKRIENNIELELPITISEAILGGEVNIPTLENPVKLKIPAGSNTGSKLRLKGKGIGGKERGDIIVTLKLVLPNKIDPELTKHINEWSSTHSYDPRANFGKE